MMNQNIAVQTTQEILQNGHIDRGFPTPQNRNPRLSKRSFWFDPIWYLDSVTPGATSSVATVYWGLELPDESSLTDPRHANLLHEFRHFVWGLLVDPRASRFGTGSANVFSSEVRYLAAWMVRRGYGALAQLDSTACKRYVEDLVADVSGELAEVDEDEEEDEAEASSEDGFNPENPGAEAAEEEGVEAGDSSYDESNALVRISAGSIARKLVVWHRLWNQRPSLSEVGISSIPERPFDGVPWLKMARRLGTKAVGQIPPVPDEVAIPIINQAHRFMERCCDDAVQLSKECANIYLGSDSSVAKDNVARRKTVTNFQFCVPTGEETPWRPSLQEEEVPAVAARQLIEDAVHGCVLIVQSDTGMRINEIAALKAGMNPTTGLPSCIEIKPSRSGMLDLYYLKGVVKKMRKKPEPTTWLVAAKPRHSLEIPAAVRAIVVIQEALQPWREAAGGEVGEMLLVSFKAGYGLPTMGKNVDRASTTYLRLAQKDFIARNADLRHLPDTAALRPYKESKGRCVKTHQWRKSYARFVHQVNGKLMPAIARQFKHLSIAMTEHSYVGTDVSLIKDIAEYNRAQTTNFLLLYGMGKAPMQRGRLALTMEKYQAEIAKLVEGKEEAEAHEAVESWVTGRDLKIFFHGYGACIPGLKPSAAECHKRAGTTHWAQKEPSYRHREPSVCTGCFLFYAGEDTQDYWSERYVRNQQAFLTAKAEGREKEFRVAEGRANQSKKFLKRLGAVIPIVEVANAG